MGSVLTISAKRGGSFFECRKVLRVLTVVPRALADVREPQPAQQLANRPLVVIDPKAALDQHLQIDAAPAYDPIRLGVRSRLNKARKLTLLLSGQPRRRTGRLAVDHSRRPYGIEPVHPVPKRLPAHAAQPRRRRPAHPLVNRGNRQQPPHLASVSGQSCHAPNPLRIPIRP